MPKVWAARDPRRQCVHPHLPCSPWGTRAHSHTLALARTHTHWQAAPLASGVHRTASRQTTATSPSSMRNATLHPPPHPPIPGLRPASHYGMGVRVDCQKLQHIQQHIQKHIRHLIQQLSQQPICRCVFADHHAPSSLTHPARDRARVHRLVPDPAQRAVLRSDFGWHLRRAELLGRLRGRMP